MSYIGILLFLQSLVLWTDAGNIGIGFSTGAPYDVALGQMRSKGVYILKTWDIQSDVLNQMEITYAAVVVFQNLV
jgi:hypothetical protein